MIFGENGRHLAAYRININSFFRCDKVWVSVSTISRQAAKSASLMRNLWMNKTKTKKKQIKNFKEEHTNGKKKSPKKWLWLI